MAMQSTNPVPSLTQKIKLSCVCGKTLDVLPGGDRDILAVARAHCWQVIGKLDGNELSALCPSCKRADQFIADKNVELAQRNS